MVIDLDWKQKIVLPVGPTETSLAFYHKTQVTLLSVGFYWEGPSGCEQRVVDIMSPSTTEDSHCTVASLKEALNILSQDGMNIGRFKTVHVWADVGSHFRSGEFCNFILHEMAVLYPGICVDMNFLVSKHGKNLRDQHFRAVRAYTDRAASEQVLTTASQLLHAIRVAHSVVQAWNRQVGFNSYQCDFYLHSIPISGSYTMKTLVFADLQQHLALRMNTPNTLQAFESSVYENSVVIPTSANTVKKPYCLRVSKQVAVPTMAKRRKTLENSRLKRKRIFHGEDEDNDGPGECVDDE